MAIQNISRWWPAAVLNLIKPEIAAFDPLTLKTIP